MMEEASKEVKAKGIFKTVARANVGQVVQKVDMIGKIQDQLATYLNITEKSEDRTSQLKARLSKGDTILVILDDVWSEIPFAEIGIPFGDSSIKGCKILLTSRMRDVCIKNKCKDPVKIEALTEEEAWDMFTKTVDISTIESVNDDSLARQVCNKCARLPLIIGAVGKALQKKGRYSWEDALRQLENCKPEKIPGIPPDAYACLRLSFKILDKDAYLCLLLCSLAGEDEEIRIKFLFRLATGSGLLEDWNTLEDARNRVHAMVSELKSSSLLLEGLRYDSVKLHDIIRDVARSITHDKESEYKFLSESNCHSLRSKKEILISRKLIYLDFKGDDVDFFDDLEPCPDLHSLFLKYSNLSDVQLPDSFFKSFPKLKYLLLDIESLSAMPSSVQNLDSLRSLAIHSCKVNDISHIIQLKNLEMLSLRNSRFGGQLLDLRQLRRLRMLDLLWCTEIMGIVLSGLARLEELYLPKDCNILDGETMRKTPLSSVTSKLTSLEINFEDVKSCPDENFCKNLCRYKIRVGGSNKIFPKFDSAMKSVYLCNDSIGGGVKTLVERGEDVTLERVRGLQECFSQGGGAFTDLKWLVIRECTGGDEYPFRIHRQPHERVGPFSKLSELGISNSGFKYLFCTSTARCLQQLEVLYIGECKMMEEIVRNEGQINDIIYFPKLRKLELVSLPVFSKSFCGKVVFPALERLEINGLDNITEIWEEHGHLQKSFSQLQCLEVRSCHKLKNVIPSAMCQRLQNLNTLRVAKCDSLISEVQSPSGAEIAEPLVVLPNLKELELRKLLKLMEIGLNSSDIILYPNLTRLIIEECDNLRNVFLPSVASHLKLLEFLLIISCKMMNEIIASVRKDSKEIHVNNIEFPMLNTLALRGLPNMNSLWGYGIIEPNLDQQKSSQTYKDEEMYQYLDLFIRSEVVFPALERLLISNMDNITEIWEEHGHLHESFCQLKSLEVEGCHKLKNVIPYAMRQRLQNLNKLHVSRCDSLISEVQGPSSAEIAEPLVVLPNLKKLKLRELPKLMETGLNSSDIILYPNLTTLYIQRCYNLRNVFLPSVASHLKLLEKLKIKSCGMMNEIIASYGKDSKETRVNNIEFPMLNELELQGLPKMNSLWGYGIREPNLDQQKSSQAYKLVFPALKRLGIHDLDNITEIWEEHGHLQESFCQLKFLEVEGCHKLKNVIPYAMRQRLQNLNTLCVSKCDSLISEVQGPSGAEIAEPLVVLPNLKELELRELLKLMETGLNSSDIILYPNLTTLYIEGCDNLRNVFLPSVASHLKLLKVLSIRSCEMMNAIIAPVGKDSKETCVNNIEFPMLKELELQGLPKMNSLWGYGIIEPNLDQQKSSQACKVSFPSLEDLSFDDLKINSEQIYLRRDLVFLRVSNCNFYECDLFSLLGNSWWKNNPYGTISFRRLQKIEVDSCMLSTIFTCSVAKALQELEILIVRSCGLIEEIVTDERRNDQLVVDTCEEISFPKLWVVELEDLPNLKSFCHSANYCFKMPSLKQVYITRCPQMLSFTPRQISTPEVHVSIKYPSLHGEEYTACEQSTTDINSYLHQIMNSQELFVNKKKELKSNHVDKGKSIVTG